MGEYDPHIHVRDTIKPKDSKYCTIKYIELEHKNLEITTPFKILEGNQINNEYINDVVKNINSPIFEAGKYVVQRKSWEKLHYLLKEGEGDLSSGIKDFFGFRDSLLKKSPLTTCSLVFARNPFVENVFKDKKSNKLIKLPPLDYNIFDTILDHMHALSEAFVLAPDIKIRKNEIITIKNYLKFVDENIKILNKWNNKPIFVPIQIQLTMKNWIEILSHYKKQNYTNIWVNFNASYMGGLNLGRVRTLLRKIDDIIGLENTNLYFTHIKKEINPDIKSDRIIASNILPTFFGADFIGVNREPNRIINQDDMDKKMEDSITKGEFKNEGEYKDATLFNRTRIFDPTTYYYFKINKYPNNLPYDDTILLKKPEVNKLVNSVLIHNEIENIKHNVEDVKKIAPYLKTKSALIEKQTDNRNILEQIVVNNNQRVKTKQSMLSTKLGRL